MKYEGTKAFQLYREVSAIKAQLVFETNVEDELREFLTKRRDLGGCVFRRLNPQSGEFTFAKLRTPGVPSRSRSQRLSRVKI